MLLLFNEIFKLGLLLSPWKLRNRSTDDWFRISTVNPFLNNCRTWYLFKMASCTILILTYKGKHHLELLLPTVKAAIEQYKGNPILDVMIVDNGSDESTRQFTQANYPDIKYLFLSCK